MGVHGERYKGESEWLLYVYNVRVGYIKLRFVKDILERAGHDPEEATRLQASRVHGWIEVDEHVRLGYKGPRETWRHGHETEAA